MSQKSNRIIVEKQPDLYGELPRAMMAHSQYQGCYVMQCSESHDGGRSVAMFILRKAEANQHGQVSSCTQGQYIASRTVGSLIHSDLIT